VFHNLLGEIKQCKLLTLKLILNYTQDTIFEKIIIKLFFNRKYKRVSQPAERNQAISLRQKPLTLYHSLVKTGLG
jgi:hypothetical protein